MTKVIIFAPNWLGDAVMALPAVADVTAGASGGSVAVAARPSVAPLFRMVPGVDEVMTLGDSLRATVADVAAASFDTAILLPNSFRAALVAFRARIPERWGYRADWRGPLLTRAIGRAGGDTHQVDAYRHLVRSLGFGGADADPRIDVPDQGRAAASALLEQAGWDGCTPLVALAPGAAFGGAKRWPAESFAELARALAGDGIRAVLVGSAADAASGRTIAAALGAGTAIDLIGRTDLPSLAGVLATVRAVVSNDSGAMHLAAAIGVPLTAIFGPTDERRTGPRSGRASPAVVLSHTVWCRPCGLRECPIGHACMRGVRVDAVLDATRRML